MADRNDYRSGDRRPRWSSQQGDRDDQQGRQFEQFDTGQRGWDEQDGSQMGEDSWSRDSERSYGSSRDRDSDRWQGYRGQIDRNQGDRSQGRYGSGSGGSYGGTGGSWNQGGQQAGRSGGQYGPQDYSRRPSDFDAAGYRTQGRGYGSFNGNDFGGRDFSNASTGWAADAYGGYAGGASGGGYGAAPSNSYGNERGFMERAGDRIASWFGDDEAQQRIDQDHRGRGPGNYTRSDQRILEDACDRITEDWRVDGTGIQVTVQNGEVTLDGTVTSREQKRRAEDCVDHISGVKHVQNNLRIQSRSGSGDSTTTDSTVTDSSDDKPAPFI